MCVALLGAVVVNRRMLNWLEDRDCLARHGVLETRVVVETVAILLATLW